MKQLEGSKLQAEQTAWPRLRRRLLQWFARNRRDLPWRHDRDPYRIWVSEVMLQQTQVAAVVPYFQRFLAAFPTLHDLAAADEQAVLRLWEGLGYYRRARHLHQAARQLAAGHAGLLPDDPALWAELPGVGRYMLGAILSQAFDRRLPIVEANSERVLCRLFGQTANPRQGAGRRWLWETAESILPRRGAGEFNQALMELGALVCKPGTPLCGACPLAEACVARRQGLQAEIPALPARRGTLEVHEAAVVIRRGTRALVVQRPTAGRWAGLWEFPHRPLAAGESHVDAAARLAHELTGVRVAVGTELCTIHHSVTHHRISMVCFEARRQSGAFHSSFYARGCWLKPDELAALPVSAPQRQLARLVLDEGRQRRLF